MPKADAPRRTILKGTLDFVSEKLGLEISIPVFVYKKGAEFKKTDSHLHHAEDKGRIEYRKFCVECGKEMGEGDIQKMVETGDGVVEVSREEITEAFNKTGTSLIAKNTISLKNLSEDMMNNYIMPKEVYTIRGFRPDNKKPPIETHEKTLRTMLSALSANNEGLMLSVALDGMQRNAILFPNGDIWTLAFAEEVREDLEFFSSDEDKTMLKGWRTLFKSREEPITEIESVEAMSEEMSKTLAAKIPAKAKAVAKAEKLPGEKIGDLNKKLAEMVEGVKAEKRPAKAAVAK